MQDQLIGLELHKGSYGWSWTIRREITPTRTEDYEYLTNRRGAGLFARDLDTGEIHQRRGTMQWHLPTPGEDARTVERTARLICERFGAVDARS